MGDTIPGSKHSEFTPVKISNKTEIKRGGTVEEAFNRVSKAVVLLVESGQSNLPLADMLTVLHAYKDLQDAAAPDRALLEEVVELFEDGPVNVGDEECESLVTRAKARLEKQDG